MLNISNAKYLSSFNQVKQYLNKIKIGKGDCVVFMGAGDIIKAADCFKKMYGKQ